MMARLSLTISGTLLLLAALHAGANSTAEIRPANYDLPKQSRLFLVRNKGKYGFIDKNAKVVVPFVFDDAKIFSEGLAAVLVGDWWGYIDEDGHFILQPKF